MQAHGDSALLRRHPPKPVNNRGTIAHRTIRPRSIRAALILMGIVAVAGCSSDDEPRAARICPRISALGDGAMLTRFAAGTGTDLTDVDYEIRIVDLQYGCQYVEDDNNNPILAVAVAPVFEANRGPANSDRQARFTYFVAIADPQDTILNKQVFDLQVTFPGNRSRVMVSPDRSAGDHRYSAGGGAFRTGLSCVRRPAAIAGRARVQPPTAGRRTLRPTAGRRMGRRRDAV